MLEQRIRQTTDLLERTDSVRRGWQRQRFLGTETEMYALTLQSTRSNSNKFSHLSGLTLHAEAKLYIRRPRTVNRVGVIIRDVTFYIRSISIISLNIYLTVAVTNMHFFPLQMYPEEKRAMELTLISPHIDNKIQTSSRTVVYYSFSKFSAIAYT